METKLLIEINNLEQGLKFIDEKLGALILNIKDLTYTKQFNCYTNEISILAERASENDVELYINLDMLYHEEDLIGLKAILKKLDKLAITGLIINDVGIIELVEELGLDFKFINGTAILNTNYASIEYTSDIYDGYFLSNEINIDEILKIAKKSSTNLFVQVYGKQKIFNSKRLLLSSYFEYSKLEPIDVSPRNYLIVSDEVNKDNQSYIYEDQHGTYIYTKNNVNALNYLHQLCRANVKYLYLNNLFCTTKEYEEVVYLFKDVLDNEDYDIASAQEKLIEISTNLSESFYDDKTVYTIEQAKLLEMDIKND
ncbi:U32 family peptidase [Erysipelotrichaceae bacterium OttesenSCG-928-M19]|nr:U32 family peptidase [Erysipelotrichaceae bacterium OttesenSCG-928-M19]